MLQSKDSWVAEQVRKLDSHILSTREPHQKKRFTQAESEEMEKIFHENGGKGKPAWKYF